MYPAAKVAIKKTIGKNILNRGGVFSVLQVVSDFETQWMKSLRL